ncbi:hypothetical protein JTB14_014627 [Gonioctena quinquepunctata]|nr:hypothetical protein JTB14_014627 [Gonioctena quinquepunctata]
MDLLDSIDEAFVLQDVQKEPHAALTQAEDKKSHKNSYKPIEIPERGAFLVKYGNEKTVESSKALDIGKHWIRLTSASRSRFQYLIKQGRKKELKEQKEAAIPQCLPNQSSSKWRRKGRHSVKELSRGPPNNVTDGFHKGDNPG